MTTEQIFALNRWMQRNRVDWPELRALNQKAAGKRIVQLEIQKIAEENHFIETGCFKANKAVSTITSTILGLEQI